MKAVLIIVLFFFTCKFSVAQVTTTTEQQIENITEALEGEPEDDQLLQQLQQYKNHPLNVNTALADDLLTLRILNDLQISSLLQYRRLFGAFIHIYELQAVPYWDVSTIQKLLPFITVAEKLALNDALLQRLKEGEHTLLLRSIRILEKQKGYNKEAATHYLGSPDRLLFRYKYVYKNLLQFGVTGDKDGGEQFFNGVQRTGFDFYSAHLFARNLGSVKAVALGDFSVNLGQGLLQWGSLAFKKGAEVINIKRQAPALQPYSSAGEYNFHRGAGATVQKKNWEATGFVSFKNISGNNTSDTVLGDVFSGLLLSGYHRTPAEIRDRKTVAQTSFGGNIAYATPFFKIGVNAVNYNFSKPLHKRDEPYNRFAIGGKHWQNYSVDYSLTVKNVHFFGEAAVAKKGGKAIISGLLAAIDPKIDFSLLYRSLSPAYQSLAGNAFTEAVYPTNEKGFYTGITLRPIVGIKIDAYADHYQFPFIKYRVDAPGGGKDYLVQVSYLPNKQTELYVRLRSEDKSSNQTLPGAALNGIELVPRQSCRIHVVHRFTPRFTGKMRTDLVWYNKGSEKEEEGFLFYTEGAYRFSNAVTTNLRLQYFETDGYNSRLYAYESDVLYGYSIPPFFDVGWRYYINASVDVSRRLSTWIKWSQTIYKNKNSIGSGLDVIEGNTKSEIKLQLRYVL